VNLVAGWLITAAFVGVVASCAGLYTSMHRPFDLPVWAIVLAVNLLAFVSGWEFARQRTRPPDTRGSPVRLKSDKDTTEV
jgi:hypothetical protein